MNDLERLRVEYANREQKFANSVIYSPLDPSNTYYRQQLERHVLRVLNQEGFNPISGFSILDVGCGSGGILLNFLSYGSQPESLHGIDLLSNRLREAKKFLPHLPFVCADGQNLPYPEDSFDIVLQYTALSSILDNRVKKNVAREMLRVLKQSGMILWYDFWLNPTNKQTRGIRPKEIRLLFPRCNFDFHRITLAPPISRRLVPISWGLAFLVEKLSLFNTHYLVAIKPAMAKV
jgi:ubiquinone/menaquinone biosynthesis C-methylase UbiE